MIVIKVFINIVTAYKMLMKIQTLNSFVMPVFIENRKKRPKNHK